MENEINFISSLVGDPVRLTIMWALMDGKAYTASELAISADTSPQNVSMHLSKLVQGEFLKVESQGRHRYYRFARDEVAVAIESLAGLIPPDKRMKAMQDPGGIPVKYCRTCYDHVAGRVGVLMTEGMLRQRMIEIDGTEYSTTKRGERVFEELGIDVGELRLRRRIFAKPCLDWSERKHHLAGSLGSALLEKMLAMDWMRRTRDSRALVVTAKGRKGLAERFACLLVFFLFIFNFGGRGQALHLRDLVRVYPLDSSAFKAFCMKNGYDLEVNRNRPEQSAFYISFRCGKDGKRELSQNFSSNDNSVPILTYLIRDKEEYGRLRKEMDDSGFLFKRDQRVEMPPDFTIDKAIYEDGVYSASLVTQTKGNDVGSVIYQLAVSRVVRRSK